MWGVIVCHRRPAVLDSVDICVVDEVHSCPQSIELLVELQSACPSHALCGHRSDQIALLGAGPALLRELLVEFGRISGLIGELREFGALLNGPDDGFEGCDTPILADTGTRVRCAGTAASSIS